MEHKQCEFQRLFSRKRILRIHYMHQTECAPNRMYCALLITMLFHTAYETLLYSGASGDSLGCENCCANTM